MFFKHLLCAKYFLSTLHGLLSFNPHNTFQIKIAIVLNFQTKEYK